MQSIQFKWLNDLEIKKLIVDLSYDNHIFYFVGGCIRDSLIGHVNINDIDICSNFCAEYNLKKLKSLGYVAFDVGIKYGCIGIKLSNYTINITTQRTDSNANGRHAEINFTHNLYEDAARRDFTINAIYMSANGNIIDYFNGLDDLKNKKLQFIGDAQKRIQEDYLRILRFFRFSITLEQFNISEDLLHILKIESNNLKLISFQRKIYELIKIIQYERSYKILIPMFESNCLNKVILTNITNIYSLKNLEENIAIYENIMNMENILLLKFSLLYDSYIMLPNQIIINKKFSNNLENIVYIKNYIIQNSIENYTDIIPILVDNNIENCIYALLCVSIIKNNQQNTHIAIIDKIKHTMEEKFPIEPMDLIEINIPHNKIKFTMNKLKYKYWENNKRSKEDYLKLAKNQTN